MLSAVSISILFRSSFNHRRFRRQPFILQTEDRPFRDLSMFPYFSPFFANFYPSCVIFISLVKNRLMSSSYLPSKSSVIEWPPVQNAFGRSFIFHSIHLTRLLPFQRLHLMSNICPFWLGNLKKMRCSMVTEPTV